SRDLNHAQRPAGKLHRGNRRIFDLDVYEAGGRRRTDRLDVAEKVLKKIEVVNALVGQRAAVERPRSPPRVARVVCRAAAPPHAHGSEYRPAKRAAEEIAPDPLDRLVVA